MSSITTSPRDWKKSLKGFPFSLAPLAAIPKMTEQKSTPYKEIQKQVKNVPEKLVFTGKKIKCVPIMFVPLT